MHSVAAKHPATILLTATAGGHLQELLALKEAYSEYELIILTDRFPWTAHLANSYLVPRWTGKRFFYLRMLVYACTCTAYTLRVFAKHRPRLIITTGAEIALPGVILGRLFGIKSIYIESVTCFDRLSLSARVALRFADRFYGQQPETVSCSPARIKYAGSIL